MGCLRVSCKVLTTLASELTISSFELNRASISARREPRPSLKSLNVLLWNSELGGGTFVELALRGQLVVCVLLQLLYLHVPLVALLLQLLLQKEQRFVHLSHVLFLARNSRLPLLVDRLVRFCIATVLLSNFSLVSRWPSSNWQLRFLAYSARSLLRSATSLFLSSNLRWVSLVRARMVLWRSSLVLLI